jgi:preprotein translocase subunit YajC
VELLILALPVVFLIAVWIFTIRPIRQRQREALAAQQAVHEGARIMTTAGIYGTVAWLDEENMGLEVSDGVVLKYARAAVATVLNDEG